MPNVEKMNSESSDAVASSHWRSGKSLDSLVADWQEVERWAEDGCPEGVSGMPDNVLKLVATVKNCLTVAPNYLDQTVPLSICEWNGEPHCVYLNDFRIAGGKPWGGGKKLKEWKSVSVRDVVRAMPSLQEALNLNYLAQPKTIREQANNAITLLYTHELLTSAMRDNARRKLANL